MKTIAVIGGTGVYSPDIFDNCENINIDTPFGNVTLLKAIYKESIVYFLERHGSGHKKAPHEVNYKANILALKYLKVDRVLATAAVGSIHHDLKPGTFVIVDQFLEFTKNRPTTLFGEGEGVVHVDMTEPYCPEIRRYLANCCDRLDIPFKYSGTYVCTEGPRFENKAEIQMFKLLGGDVVGMTNFPEVVMAREAELCYGAVALVTNYCTGIANHPLTHKEVMDNMSNMAKNIKELFLLAFDEIPSEKNCSCSFSASEKGSLK